MENPEKRKITFEKLKTANAVAVMISIFCFVFLLLLLFVEVPQNNRDIVNFLSGSMFATGFGGVVYFLFNFKKDTKDPVPTDSYETFEYTRCSNCPNLKE